MIYFIQQGEYGPIKIGKADDVYKRLNNLQTSNPILLRLVGTWEGGLEEEQYLHNKFAKSKLRGEWFRATKDLCAFANTQDFLPVIGVAHPLVRKDTIVGKYSKLLEEYDKLLVEYCGVKKEYTLLNTKHSKLNKPEEELIVAYEDEIGCLKRKLKNWAPPPYPKQKRNFTL